jgi:hypothetical protein
MIRTGIAVARAGMYTATAYSFDRVCTAPCVAELPPGSYHYVLEDSNGRQYGGRRPVLLNHDATLDLRIESRRRQRVVRWLTSIALLGAGAGMLVSGFLRPRVDDFDDWYGESNTSWPLVGLGAATAAAGYGLLFAAIWTRDRGHVTVRPQ